MEDIEQMRRRHEREIEVLEKGCPHNKLSKWMDFMWAPGHFSGRVKVCLNCGKTIKSDNLPGPMLQHSIDNPPRPLTEEELLELKI